MAQVGAIQRGVQRGLPRRGVPKRVRHVLVRRAPVEEVRVVNRQTRVMTRVATGELANNPFLGEICIERIQSGAGVGLLVRNRENVGNLLREINIFPTYSPHISTILATKCPPQHFIKKFPNNSP